MGCARVRSVLAPLFALAFTVPLPAVAFVGPPYLTPAQPTENDIVEVNVYRDECEIIDGGFPWPPPLTINGPEITILFTGGHEDDPLFCIFGSGVETHAVGRFPPGSYTLEVERRYTSLFTGWVQESLGVIPFTVDRAPSSSPPSEAPTLSTGFLFLLVLATAGIAGQRLHSRRRGSSRSI